MAENLLTLGSLFSGIEGFGLGFERVGFQIKWQVERDKFCRRVLRNHWPAVHRFADVSHVGKRNLKPVDCITAGVPCQDVSVAGLRAGLAGKRTGFFYEFARILRELRPRWFVMENVPGLFSSKEGRDFAEILRVFVVECGYGVSWRVLDSRYFGVAQRRRRVFIVGYFGKPCPPEILFEREGSVWHPTARGKKRQDFASALDGSPYADREAKHTRLAILTASAGHHGHSSDRGDGNSLVATLQGAEHNGEPEPGNGIIAVPLSAGSFFSSHSPGRRREDDFNLVATLNSGGEDARIYNTS